MASKPSSFDWIDIEGQYRAGRKTINAIAAENGCSEGAIRKRAKKYGWSRDPSGLVREQVRAIIAGAGTVEGTRYATRTAAEIAAAITSSMQLSEKNAIRILNRVAQFIEIVEEPRDLKILCETNIIALESIRRIHGLDASQEDKSGATVIANQNTIKIEHVYAPGKEAARATAQIDYVSGG